MHVVMMIRRIKKEVDSDTTLEVDRYDYELRLDVTGDPTGIQELLGLLKGNGYEVS